jgi:ADP-ribose pyrophosphatase YjhB (NUDIX family)
MRSSDYRYCPRCRAKLQKRDRAFDCPECGMTVYMNSAPTAAMLIVRKDQVLLARRGFEPFKGRYDIVGGFLEYGEHPVAGIRREVREETGLQVKVLDLLGVYMDSYGPRGKSTLNFYYVGSIIRGRMRARDDVAQLKWFPLSRLPRLAFRSQAAAVRDLRRWVREHGAS